MAIELSSCAVRPTLMSALSTELAERGRPGLEDLLAMAGVAASADRPPAMIEHEDRALSPELVRQLRRLSDEDRDALLLVVWGELSYEEAAAALEVPIGTVKSRIARARRALAAHIGPLERRRSTQLRETELFSA